MFLGVPPSAPWRHTSCTATAPALRFPKFLSVQITADNPSYLCQYCNASSHCSPVLEIPFSDSVVHSSFPHTLSWFCSLICFSFSPRTQLTFLTENWATVNIWHDQFCSPTKYDWPFSSDPNWYLLLLICFTLHLTFYFCSHIPRSFPSSIQRSLHLPFAECLQSQKLFLWVKYSLYIFLDHPCQRLSFLSDTCPAAACSHLHETIPVLT